MTTTGAARFVEQQGAKKKKWYHRIRNRIIFNMKRLRLTTKAHCAFVVLPETLNAATYSTSGDLLDFVERFYMAIQHAQNLPSSSVRVDINEVLSVMDDEGLLSNLKAAAEYARKAEVEQPRILGRFALRGFAGSQIVPAARAVRRCAWRKCGKGTSPMPWRHLKRK